MYEIVERVDKFEAIKKAERSGKLSSFLGDSNSDLFSELSKDIHLYPISADGLNWCEVDDSKDLDRATSFKW